MGVDAVASGLGRITDHGAGQRKTLRSIRFWGTRGGLPAALTAAQVRRKLERALRGVNAFRFESEQDIQRYLRGLDFPVSGTFGGHSSCVEVDAGADVSVLCDLGSGLRAYAEFALPQTLKAGRVFHVFMSRLDYEHMMGLPFMSATWAAGNHLVIYGCHPQLEDVFRQRLAELSSPDVASPHADALTFTRLVPGVCSEAAGMRVTPVELPRQWTAYRFESRDRVVVYCPGLRHESDPLMPVEALTRLARDADVFISGAMPPDVNARSAAGGELPRCDQACIELCRRAGAKHLVLFHHATVHDDDDIEHTLALSRWTEQRTRTGAALRITAAYDGMTIDLPLQEPGSVPGAAVPD